MTHSRGRLEMVLLRILAAVILGTTVASAAGTTQAPSNAKQDIEQVCTDGPSWQSSLDDSIHIEDMPIPASYVETLSAPCYEWGYIEEAVVRWHLRFGSAHSVGAALAYMEKDTANAISDPERLPTALRDAFDAAHPDILRVESMGDLEYRYGQISPEQRKAIKRFFGLVDLHGKYFAFAQMYLEAAEEFQDSGLLDKADLYLKPAYEGALYLDGVQRNAPPHRNYNFELRMDQLDDLRARAALLRAEVTQSKDDIVAARQLVLSEEEPVYATAIWNLLGNRPICTPSPFTSDVQRQCTTNDKNDGDLEARVVNYAVNRAALDLVAPDQAAKDNTLAVGSVANWSNSMATAMQLLRVPRQMEAWESVGDRIYAFYGGARRLGDAVIHRLLLLDATVAARRLKVGPKLAGLEGRALYDAMEDWTGALDAAGNLVWPLHPSEEPGQFERAARRWLAIWEARDTFPVTKMHPRWAMGGAEEARFAAYLTATLANMDPIRRGAAE